MEKMPKRNKGKRSCSPRRDRKDFIPEVLSGVKILLLFANHFLFLNKTQFYFLSLDSVRTGSLQ